MPGGDDSGHVMAAVDVRDVEVRRMPAKIGAEPERQEELQIVRDPVGEIREDADVEVILGAGQSARRDPGSLVAHIGGADCHPMLHPGETPAEAGDDARNSPVGPGLLVIGGDLQNP